MKECDMLEQPTITVLPVDFHLVNASGKALRLSPGRTYTIGRDASCDIRITDALMSRVHCRLEWHAGSQWTLVDNNSRNGTFVNEQLVEGQVVLHDKNTIRLGGQVLTLYYVQLGKDAKSELSGHAQHEEGTLDLAEVYKQKGPIPASIVGSLQTTPLSVLLKTLETNANSGRIIFDEVEDRSLWLELGDPIHALFEQEEGKEAMLAIIRSARTFAFYENENLAPSAEPNLKGDEVEMVLQPQSPTGRIRRTGTVVIGTEELPPMK